MTNHDSAQAVRWFDGERELHEKPSGTHGAVEWTSRPSVVVTCTDGIEYHFHECKSEDRVSKARRTPAAAIGPGGVLQVVVTQLDVSREPDGKRVGEKRETHVVRTFSPSYWSQVTADEMREWQSGKEADLAVVE
ncbi:hypothetical protein GCM10027060_26340 [Nesterenkonia halophila]